MNFTPHPRGYQATVAAALDYRANPDEQIRLLQRAVDQEPTKTNYMLLNAALLRAGQLPQPKVWIYGEGWQVQTYLPDGRTISSAMQSHDGWWGVGHVTWIGDGDMLDLGDHFIREYPGRRFSLAEPAKPAREEVEAAHQGVVEAFLREGEAMIPRSKFRRWPALNPPDTGSNRGYRRNIDEDLRDLERRYRMGDESVKERLRAAYRRAGLLPDSCDVRLSYLTRRELAKAIRADHDCDESACDIPAALDNGFEEVAADLLMSATECENLERLLDEYDVDLYGLNIMNERYMHPRGWREWVSWFDAHAIQCPSCETYNFPAGSWVPTTCGNCRESLDTEPDAEDE